MPRPRSIKQLVDALQKLPGVGPRSGVRMAESILAMNYDDALELSRAVLRVKKSIIPCSVCCVHTEKDPCDICSDPDRDNGFICVVQEAEDVEAFERSRTHQGLYHVLGGLINPTRGIGPDKIRLFELYERVNAGNVREVLIATDPSVEGDATAAHIYQKLKGADVRLTRPARGIPMGADIDYLDGQTLKQAFSARLDLLKSDHED